MENEAITEVSPLISAVCFQILPVYFYSQERICLAVVCACMFHMHPRMSECLCANIFVGRLLIQQIKCSD